MIDTILKILMIAWLAVTAFYVGYCCGLVGLGKNLIDKLLNDEGEEDEDDTRS